MEHINLINVFLIEIFDDLPQQEYINKLDTTFSYKNREVGVCWIYSKYEPKIIWFILVPGLNQSQNIVWGW